MTFGLTRGEILLIAFVFALVYGAGLLPRLVAWLSGASRTSPSAPTKEEPEGEPRGD